MKANKQNKEFDIVVIGSALVDSIIKGFNPEPISASGYIAKSATLSPGGEGINESCAFKKLGLNTALYSAFGEDGAGTIILNELNKHSVDTSLLVIDSEIHTPISTLMVNDDGSRKSITNDAHKYNFHPESRPERFTCAKYITLASLFRAPFNDPEIIYDVVKTAHNAGCKIYADTKLPNFVKLTLDDIKDSLPFIDGIFPNEDEAKYYSKEEDPDRIADKFLSYGIKNIIVKLGAEGCLFKNAAERYRIPAYKIVPVDATGAGDNLIAGFIAAKHYGYDNLMATKIGNACGALCTSTVGGTNGVKSMNQVLKFIEEQEKLV